MAATVDGVVILPRYSSFLGPPVGDLVLYTAPVNVRRYASADIAAWKGSHSGTVAMALEGSPDLESWVSLGTVTLSAGQETVTAFGDLESEWVRLKITLTNGPAVTCWMVGNFTTRA